MQTAQVISIAHLHELVRAVYDQGEVVVKQAYSDFDCQTRSFPDAAALIDHMAYEPGSGDCFFYFSIYYPEAGGYVFEKRIELKPGAGNGHRFRFSQEGWGLIHLQCQFRDLPKIECRISVNSESRAEGWFNTRPEFKPPNLWNWKVVKSKAGRLIRILRRFGNEAGQWPAQNPPERTAED